MFVPVEAEQGLEHGPYCREIVSLFTVSLMDCAGSESHSYCVVSLLRVECFDSFAFLNISVDIPYQGTIS